LRKGCGGLGWEVENDESSSQRAGVTTFGKSRRGRRAAVLLLALALALAVSVVAVAAPGDLDRTFGGDGKVGTDFTPHDDFAAGIAVQSDGRIVVAGTARASTERPRFALARYKSDGTLDSTFGGDGKVGTRIGESSGSFAVALQADGKIVAAGGAVDAGHGLFALARYNADGTLDPTFGVGGTVTTAFPGFVYGFVFAFAVAVQADGKIVAGGEVYPTETLSTGAFALARYNADGTLDSTFDGDGRVVTDMSSGADHIAALAIQADGKIVAAGSVNALVAGDTEFGLARYETDGTLDSSFDGDGRVTTDFTTEYASANDMVIQSDGKIVAVGSAAGKGSRFALARYNTDGTLDSTFSGDGKATTNFTPRSDGASGVAIQATGKIVAAGWASVNRGDFALARYKPDGTLDTSFGGDGRVMTRFSRQADGAQDVAIQLNGRIVAAGRAGGEFRGRFGLDGYRGG
jgi:uncharacterized delta-60 repeat protein